MSMRPLTVTIADSTAISGAIDLQPGERLVGVITPAEWTAADIGFAASVDGTNYFRIVDPARTTAATSHSRIINVETAAARYYAVPESMDLEVANHIKITSINTASNADVNQAAARTCVVVIEKRY